MRINFKKKQSVLISLMSHMLLIQHSYIALILGIRLWKGALPRPSHRLPRYNTTSECGPLPLGEEIFN